MRQPFACLVLLASLALPSTASAQDAEVDSKTAAMLEMLTSDEGLPQANLGEQDNGWLLSHDKGKCRMYSFNDPLALEADPANPANSGLRFQFFDSVVPEADGAQVKLMIVVRDKPDAEFGGFPATLVVSKKTPSSYFLPLSMKELVSRFPNGFQMVLADATGKSKIMQSDTLGSGKHLAELATCEQG